MQLIQILLPLYDNAGKPLPAELFTEVRQHFSERQAVELSMLIGAYNMLTRFLKALKVDPEPS